MATPQLTDRDYRGIITLVAIFGDVALHSLGAILHLQIDTGIIDGVVATAVGYYFGSKSA